MGTSTSSGGVCYDAGDDSICISGSGSGIFGTTDQFHYCYQQVSGDFEVVVRMDTFNTTGQYVVANTGLMIRKNLNADSCYAANGPYAVQNRPRMFFRENDGERVMRKDIGQWWDPVTTMPNKWLKMQRYKDRISTYVGKAEAIEDVKWIEVNTATLVGLPENNIYVGVYITKDNSTSNPNAIFRHFDVYPLQRDYQTTWVGNTWPCSVHMPHWIEDIFVDPDAKRIYTNSRWEEAGRELCVFDDNGVIQYSAQDTHPNGVAVAVGDGYIYGGKMDGSEATHVEDEWYIARWNMDGTNRQQLKGVSLSGQLHGMAVDADADDWYVAKTFDNEIAVYNTQSLAFKRLFPADNPRNMVWHNDALYVSTGEVSGQPAKVIKYDANGQILLSIMHDDLRNPDDLAIHPGTGHLWVCDNDPEIHQILIFDTNTGNRVTDTYLGQDYFGDRGGIYSGVPGEVQPTKFNYFSGVGFMKSDDWNSTNQHYDIIVATNGPPTSHIDEGTGCVLRKFNPWGQQPDLDEYWTRYGLEFLDVADADPGTDGLDIFTQHGHYVMNWNVDEGQNQLWTYRGFTLDKFTYPDDHRNWEGINMPEPGYRARHQSGTFIRRIEGQRFLYVTDQHSDSLSYYRFTPGSEIAIPCGRMDRNITDPSFYNIMNQWLIWRDVNGDGQQSKETEWDTSHVHGDNTEDWYVDINGDIWVPSKWYGIKHFICEGLDANGVPMYSWASYEHFEPPTEFKVPFIENPLYQLCRLVYVPDSDNLDGTMFLMGYTDLFPRNNPYDPINIYYEGHNPYIAGRELICYENWYAVKGPRTIRWRVNGADEISDIPYRPISNTDVSHGGDSLIARSLTAAGGKVFVTMNMTADTFMFDAQTGELEKTLVPGPEVGGVTGWYDIPHATNAYQRSNGEILVFLEEDYLNKVNIYRLNEGLDITAPAAPSGLSGFVSNYVVSLDWPDNTDPDLDGYNVYRAAAPGGPYPSGPFGQQINRETLAGSQFTDYSVEGSTTYYYIVRAIDTSGNESTNSNEIHVNTPATPVVDAPDNLATVAMDGKVDLTWTCSTSTDPAVLYYKVYRSLVTGGPYHIAAIAFGGCGITDSQVENEVTYYYVVSAVNAIGLESGQSNEAQGTPQIIPPIAPTGLTAVTQSYYQIDLAWTDNSDDETGFELERSDAGGSFVPIDTVGTNDTTYIDLDLNGSTEYCYRVRAVNSAGSSTWSNAACDTTELEIPDGPDSLLAGAVGESAIFLIWDDTDVEHTTTYQVERTTDAAMFYVTAPQNSYTDTGLSAGTTYDYRIQACNSNGCSAWKASAGATTAVVLPPVPPGELAATTVSPSEIDLAWENNSTTASTFEIQRKSGAGQFNDLTSVPGNVTSYSDAGLEASTQYVYRVRAVNSVGASAYGFPATAVTDDPIVITDPPTSPSSLQVSQTGSTWIVLQWYENADNELGFKIERRMGSGDFYQIDKTSANVTSYIDRGVSPSTSYTYRVRAYNQVGDSAAYTNTASTTTSTGESHQVLFNLDFQDGQPRFAIKRSGDALTPTVVDIGGGEKVLKLGDRGSSGFNSSEFSYEITSGPAITEINNVLSNIGGPSVDFLFCFDTRRLNPPTINLPGDGNGKICIFAHGPDGNDGSPPTNGQGLDFIWTHEPLYGINPWGVPGFADGEWINIGENVFPKGGTFFPHIPIPHRGFRFTVTPKSTGPAKLVNKLEIVFDVAAESAVNEESLYVDNMILRKAASVRPSPPAFPDNLAVQASGSHSIDLTWRDNADDETLFRIVRSTDGVNFHQIATVPADSITYVDDDLLPETEYAYRVAAVNDYGDSWFTRKRAATTLSESQQQPKMELWRVDFQDRKIPVKNRYGDTNGSMKLVRHFNQVGNFALELTDKSIGGEGNASEFYITLDYFNPVTLRINQILRGSTSVDMLVEFDIQRSQCSNNRHVNNGRVCLEAGPSDGNPPQNGYGRDSFWTGRPVFAGPDDPMDGYVDGELVHMDGTIFPQGYDATAPYRGFRFTIRPDGSGRTINEITFRLDVGTAASAQPEAMTIDNITISELAPAGNGSKPAAPSNLVATSISDTTIKLTWDDHSDNETRFKVWRKTGAGNYQLVAIVPENTIVYNDTTVRPETRYTYLVRSNNPYGDSVESTNEDSATTQPYTTAEPPDGPSGLMVEHETYNTVQLSWVDNANNEASFMIERADGIIGAHGGFTVIDTISSNNEVENHIVTYNDTGLVTTSQYTYRVIAANAQGQSYSNEDDITVQIPAVPNVPYTPDARGFTEKQVVMFWNWASYTDDADCFRLERTLIDPLNPEQRNYAEIATFDIDEIGYVDTNVVSDQLYTYRIRACNSVDGSACLYCSDYSAENTAYVFDRPPQNIPATVPDLQANAINMTEIEVRWDVDTNADYYDIERSLDGNSWSHVTDFTWVRQAVEKKAKFIDSNLLSETMYFYRVRGHNTSGEATAWSNTTNATTQGPPSPPAPSDLGDTYVSTNQIAIAWRDNSDIETGFHIDRKLESGSFVQVATVGANVTSYTSTGLTEGLTYVFRVRAYNANGESFSNEDSATTQFTGPPPAPQNLSATPDAARIDLTWDHNAENEDYFVIERKPESGSYSVLAGSVPAGSTSYADTGLPDETTYYYRVRAVNGFGSSGWSNEDWATTPNSSLPVKPTNLQVLQLAGQNALELNWNDAAGNESGFEIERTTDGATFNVGADVETYTDTGLVWGALYTYRVRAWNSYGQSAWEGPVSQTVVSINPTTEELDDTHGDISYSGNWTLQSWSERYNNTCHESDDSNGEVNLSFNGFAIRIYGERAPWGGTADVYIDTNLEGSIDFGNGDHPPYTVEMFSITGLTSGPHTLRIDHTGNGYIYIDKIEYDHY